MSTETNNRLLWLYEIIEEKKQQCRTGFAFALEVPTADIDHAELPPVDRKLEGLQFGMLNLNGHHLPKETPPHVPWRKRFEIWAKEQGVEIDVLKSDQKTLYLRYANRSNVQPNPHLNPEKT